MVKLENQQSFLQQTLDSALVGTGWGKVDVIWSLVQHRSDWAKTFLPGLVVLVLNAEVTSGPAPTTSRHLAIKRPPNIPHVGFKQVNLMGFVEGNCAQIYSCFHRVFTFEALQVQLYALDCLLAWAKVNVRSSSTGNVSLAPMWRFASKFHGFRYFMMFFKSFEFVSPRKLPKVCEDTYGGLDCSQRICPSCQNNGSCVEGGQVRPTMWISVTLKSIAGQHLR